MKKIVKYKDREFEVLIDDEDEELYNQHKWYAYPRYDKAYIGSTFWNKNSNVYWKDRKMLNVRLHRFIMGVTDPKILVDHINGNPLDNRKSNLRICDSTGNARNSRKLKKKTSIYKGVYRSKLRKAWACTIRINGKNKVIDFFQNEIEAAKAYDEAAKEHYGEFAKTNF